MRLFLQLTPNDIDFLPALKPILHGHSVRFNANRIDTITEVEIRAREFGCTQIATTSQKLLTKLLGREDERKQPTLDDFAGSIVRRGSCEYLILNPLEQLFTVPYGKFLFQRYLSKYTEPRKWFPIPNFSWEVAEPARLEYLYSQFTTADLIACDIETIPTDLSITCSGYCGIWFNSNSNSFRVHAIIIPCKTEYDLAWIAKFNQLGAPKIFQNGKYDNAYFLRWGIPVNNWVWDTAHLFHSWYSELPKRLDFITSFSLREWIFWKDESSAPIHSLEYYRYNAKDSFGTALSFLALMAEAPEWARNNYRMEFPLVFPCLQAELTGLKLHGENFESLRQSIRSSIDSKHTALCASIGRKEFNPNSSQQVVRLFKVLGSGDVTSSDAASRDRVKVRHPLNRFFVDTIEAIRKERKLLSSYLKDGLTLNGRVLYQLNPHGTDTGRLASSESHFWCGLQIQNIPRERGELVYKSVFRADDGFEIGEGDYEQAETRDTAYLSGDEQLLRATSSDRDFHGVNAAAFFGVAYEKIMGTDGSILDKELRDLAKRVNHGANYNMGAEVLLNTMGIENVLRAKRLLRLSNSWSLRQVTEYLLRRFTETYPIVKGQWYTHVKYAVKTSKMLIGPTGWTRYCFSDPERNKHALNAYVAHPPQSLNAMTLNKAWLKVFYEVALPNPNDFKLCAQIHDSILFQYRTGRDDLVRAVYAAMLMDTSVTDCFGKVRILRVPVAMKAGGQTWGALRKFQV